MNMSKRAFIIHGWEGSPEEGWFPWLKAQLEQRGFVVIVPEMPDTENPQIEPWINRVKEVVAEVDEHTYFIGHSIGCQTIMRFLETLPDGKRIGGAVFVAGWFHLMGLGEEELPIAEPWLTTPIDCTKVLSHMNPPKVIFSNNDDVVPMSEKEIFEHNLQAECVVLHEMGHFSGEDGVTELPEALEAILTMAK